MREFLKYKYDCDYHLYNMVINKEIKKGDICAIKILLNKPLAERSLQDLIDVDLLTEDQRKIVEASEAHATYMVSDAVILDLVEGIEPDLEKFLAVSADWIEGGILAALFRLRELGGRENFLNMVGSGLFVQSRNVGNLKATPLHLAVFSKDLEAVRSLLNAGAPINRTDRYGHTALHYVVQHNLLEMAQLLVDNNAGLHFEDWRGHTPLLEAVKKRSVPMTRILLSTRQAIDQKDKSGLTPLHYAVADNQPELVGMLIAAGADLNVQSEKGWTPLHHAVAGKYPELTQTLIAAEPNINLQTKEGWTALHMAVLSRLTHFVELITATGEVDWTLQDKAGQTVLGLAITLRYSNIVKILRHPYPDRPAPSLTWGNRFIYHFGSSIGATDISDPVPSLISSEAHAVEQDNDSEPPANGVTPQQEVVVAEAPTPEISNARTSASKELTPYEIERNFFSEIEEKLKGSEEALTAAYFKSYGLALLLLFGSSITQFFMAPKDDEPIERTPFLIAVSFIVLGGSLMLLRATPLDYRRGTIGRERHIASWA